MLKSGCAVLLSAAVLALLAVPARGASCDCVVTASASYPGMEKVDCTALSLFEFPDDCIDNSVNVSELILSRNLLTEIRSTTLAELTQLRTLYLDNNELSFVDVSAFEFMTKLELLSLDHNLELQLETDTFSTLVKLQHLTTIGTNLEYLPDITGLPDLNWVDFRSSAVVSLPTQLFSPELTSPSMYVSVDGNEIVDASVLSFVDLPDDTILHVDDELLFWARDSAERDAFIVRPWDVNVDLATNTKICDVDGTPGDLSVCFEL